jgi:TP901 family phage tail tape measure protein
MSSRDLSVALRLLADSSSLDRGLRGGQSSVKRFAQGVKREFEMIGTAWNSLGGRLATLGVGVGVADQLRKSAMLDKTLRQTGNTAGFTGREIAGLRGELFAQSKMTGASVESLKEGYDAYIAAGQSAAAAREEIKATNIAMAVTGADARTLAGGLTVAGEAFQFNLESPGMALKLLDQMAVAGRKGNAELENLSGIFSRVGVNAASAGLGFEKTLGFIEALSLVERQPERLATLADSTLRLFNNLKYSQKATEATGVKFFDAEGKRKDALDVLKEFRAEYQKLKTDQQRANFVQGAFGEADLDTIRGLRTFLGGDALDKVTAFEKDIKSAGGTLVRELPGALNNAIDQAGRLKTVLREAADGFAQPINQAIAGAIKYGLDTRQMSGGELMGAGAGLAAGAYFGGRMLGGIAGRVLQGVGGTAAGVATGKALESATGVQPVFVTNWPGGIGGLGSAAAGAGAAALGAKVFKGGRVGAALLGGARLGAIPMMGSGAMATAGGAGLAAFGAGGAAGYGLNRATQGSAFGNFIDQIAAGIARKVSGKPDINRAIERPDATRFDASRMPAQIGAEFDRRLAPMRSDTAESARTLQRIHADQGPALRSALDSTSLPQRIATALAVTLSSLPSQIAAAVASNPPQTVTVNVAGGMGGGGGRRDRLNMDLDNGKLWGVGQ